MWPKDWSVRIIGTKDCFKCQSFKAYLDDVKYPYEFMDADLPEHQAYLDERRIKDMPVLQILYSGEVKHQFLPGIHATKTILLMMKAKGAKT